MEVWYLISYLFMFFFVASLIGYVCEVVYCSINNNKFEWNRGFLLGPYIPIYGVGTIVVLFLLRDYFNDPKALFCLSFLICTILEYVTSFIMEKLFKVRWWDYSEKPFNIEGRVCLLNSVLFGLAGLIVVYFLRPVVLHIFNLVPHIVMISIATLCEFIFFTDLVVTTITLISIRITLTGIKRTKEKDCTESTREKVVERIRKNSTLYNLLLKAFPYIDGVNEDSFKELRLLVNTVRKTIKAGETVVNSTKKVAQTTKIAVVSTAEKIKQDTQDTIDKTKNKLTTKK
jgi:uncharacterized membrane protein